MKRFLPKSYLTSTALVPQPPQSRRSPPRLAEAKSQPPHTPQPPPDRLTIEEHNLIQRANSFAPSHCVNPKFDPSLRSQTGNYSLRQRPPQFVILSGSLTGGNS